MHYAFIPPEGTEFLLAQKSTCEKTSIFRWREYSSNVFKFILLIAVALVWALPSHALSLHNKPVKETAYEQLQARHNHELVVLIHGLLRSSWSMIPLKSYLEKQGYQVYSYNYPSTRYSIQQHGVYLKQFINDLVRKNPKTKIHFVTHSLGGIITREALASLSPKQVNNVGYLIMLAPPNQGSLLAKISTTLLPIVPLFIKPLGELSSDQKAYVHQVPIPNVKIGIIAGRFDAKVPPSAARLPGQNELVVINAAHTFIMNNARAKKLVLTFLETGAFMD